MSVAARCQVVICVLMSPVVAAVVSEVVREESAATAPDALAAGCVLLAVVLELEEGVVAEASAVVEVLLFAWSSVATLFESELVEPVALSEPLVLLELLELVLGAVDALVWSDVLDVLRDVSAARVEELADEVLGSEDEVDEVELRA